MNLWGAEVNNSALNIFVDNQGASHHRVLTTHIQPQTQIPTLQNEKLNYQAHPLSKLRN